MSEETPELRRVMVIAAHPDDPEFGAGATIGKWAHSGREITYVLLTSGDKGSHDRKVMPGEIAAQREEEQRAAARVLGVKDVIFLRYPDGVLEPTMALRRQLAALIREHQPDILLAIDPWRTYQLHPDHRAAGFLATDAVYAAREWYIFPEQLLGDREPWRVREIYLFWTENPDYWEDVTEWIDLRVESLKAHHSQVMRRLDTLGDRVREGAAKTGEQPGYKYAEAFKLIKLG
jgi:LmbE family N-acetylglucosaminyl deacetylase